MPSSTTKAPLLQQDSNRTYGVKINPYENTIHYLDQFNQQQLSSNYENRPMQEQLPISTTNRLATDPTVYDIKTNFSAPITHQQQIPTQIEEKLPQQRITRLIFFIM